MFTLPEKGVSSVEHSNSGKKSFDSILAAESIFSIRFGNLINLLLVHWYSNSKLGVNNDVNLFFGWDYTINKQEKLLDN